MAETGDRGSERLKQNLQDQLSRCLNQLTDLQNARFVLSWFCTN